MSFPNMASNNPKCRASSNANGGFCLASGQTWIIHAPWDWSGHIWARTECNFSLVKNSQPVYQTGDCDGRLECNGLIGTPPATLVELTLLTNKNQPSYYDICLVDGYNLPVWVSTKGLNNNNNCLIRSCLKDMNERCLIELQVKDKEGYVVACKSACLAYNLDRFCCRNEYDTPNNCTPSSYSNVFKDACPSYVGHAYDSHSPLVSCLVKELDITFSPDKWGDIVSNYANV